MQTDMQSVLMHERQSPSNLQSEKMLAIQSAIDLLLSGSLMDSQVVLC